MSTAIDQARAELSSRCNAIEECYEYMLAYAAQGLPSDQGTGSGAQVRDHLRKCDAALVDLSSSCSGSWNSWACRRPRRTTASSPCSNRDASDSRAAVHLVLAQPAISSQLIDNLNASIHLRALLTDLFLIDEILKTHGRQAAQ